MRFAFTLALAKNAVQRAPRVPPIPWTPKVSSESSSQKRFLIHEQAAGGAAVFIDEFPVGIGGTLLDEEISEAVGRRVSIGDEVRIHLGIGEERRAEGTESAADTVDAEGVERVVIAKALLEP